MTQQVVFKFPLDHLPIMLSSEVISHRLRPFCFFNVWCEHAELRSVVKEQ